MTTYLPPKKNTALVFGVSLWSQATSGSFQANPTLAAGDVKISKDGGAFANLTNLPTVNPASGKRVEVSLTSTEMNADNVTVIFSDAAGAEWFDLAVHIQTSARQIDDLAFPTTSGRSLDVTATGAAGIDWGNVENPTTAVNLSGTNIDPDQVVASVSGAVASVTGAVGSVTGNVGGNVVGSVGSVTGLTASNLDATISSRASAANLATVAGYLDTEIATIITGIDALPTNAELATALGTADDAVLAAIAALNDLSAADVAGEITSAALATAAALATVDGNVDTLVTRLSEMWALDGLDIANPMTVTPTSRETGTLSQTISGDGTTTTTVTRDP